MSEENKIETAIALYKKMFWVDKNEECSSCYDTDDVKYDTQDSEYYCEDCLDESLKNNEKALFNLTGAK